MNRDGSNTSIWQHGMPDYKLKTEKNNLAKTFDALVVGGGITGITTGLLLQKEGKSVMIAEAQNIGFGTTGGTTAHLNSFLETPFAEIRRNFGEKNAQLAARAIRQSLELIKKNVLEYSIDCGYKELPGYLY